MRRRNDHGERSREADAVRRGARILRGGGVIAYPNESVYGLGCLPGNEPAVERVLRLKGRKRSLGLILIAHDWEGFQGWVESLDAAADPRALRESEGITWVLPAASDAPEWITGGRDTLAVRRSLHPLAAELSRTLDSPLVSTSCNPHGLPPARTAAEALDYFGGEVDWVMPGECGPLQGPTEIRDAATGAVLRPALGRGKLQHSRGAQSQGKAGESLLALAVAKAAHEMVVDEAAGLKMRIHDDGAHELEAASLEIGGKAIGNLGNCGHFPLFAPVVHHRPAVHETPDVAGEGAEFLAHLKKARGVVDRG